MNTYEKSFTLNARLFNTYYLKVCPFLFESFNLTFCDFCLFYSKKISLQIDSKCCSPLKYHYSHLYYCLSQTFIF